MDVQLEQEQADLLTALVEEHRRVPRERRDRFYVSNTNQGSHAFYPKAQDGWQIPVVQGDLEVLASYGLISVDYGQYGISGIVVRPEGLSAYEQLRRQAGEPVANVEREIRRYLDTEAFQARYPTALAKWREAEDVVWQADAPRALTTIGHLCREAMQLFASELIRRYQPTGSDPEPAHDVARIRAVLDLAKIQLGKAEAAFLDALVTYWGTVSDLAQRQEHGAQKEGEALQWEDARRLVFQTAIVMFEVARSAQSALGAGTG